MGNAIKMMMSILAGAGFDKITKGISSLSSSGTDLQAMMSLPAMPFMMVGAGVKDAANSMDVLGPMMKLLMPPQPPPPPNPQEVGAAMQMLSARLGPGMSGIQVPAGAPAMAGGAPPQMGGY